MFRLLGVLSGSGLLTDVGHGLREGFFMFWETLWALVVGFGLSGAVQAFSARGEMQRRLGDHGARSVVRAAAYGMVSSSCSYAASAMARSLFIRGADFLASMVFLFASTNLVFELGMVLVVLIGWQFLAAEFVGGAVMIALLVLVGGLWFRGRALAEARTASSAGASYDRGTEAVPALGERLRSGAGWADAAGYTISDLTMLRNELVIGFTAAGFLAALVPTRFWNGLFLHGHGFWTTLENVLVGPFVAVISFVCSIGNVPLAAALWKGGITFGGVVSFVFADLITLPILLIYRKQYGARMALRMLLVFWAVMSLAGLATEYLFRGLGWIPRGHPKVIAAGALRWDHTTVLDILALMGFAGLYWVHRNRRRFGGGAGYAPDPVCGMQVEVAQAPAALRHSGEDLFFCSEHCRERFEKNPQRYLAPAQAADNFDRQAHGSSGTRD